MATKPKIRCDFFHHISRDHKRALALLSNCNHDVPPNVKQRIHNLKVAYEKAKKNNSPDELEIRQEYDKEVMALVMIARSKRQAVYAHTMARRASTPDEIANGQSKVEEMAFAKWMSF